jgi:hypothetical protein
MMAVLVTVLVILFWVAGSIAVLALLTARKMRKADKRQVADGHRRGSQIHGRRAEADAEIEEHDIDQTLDAINEHRRRAGRREIGEELADELMRSTWDDRV